jgi:hypothetical protein
MVNVTNVPIVNFTMQNDVLYTVIGWKERAGKKVRQIRKATPSEAAHCQQLLDAGKMAQGWEDVGDAEIVE